MDYFRDRQRVRQRLLDEYHKHKSLIIACDFDDTIFDCHNRGCDYSDVIALLKRWENRAKIVIWTARSGEQLDEVVDYVEKIELKIYGINVNTIEEFDCRKIYANAFLDDRAGLAQTYEDLLYVIEEIEKEEC